MKAYTLVKREFNGPEMWYYIVVNGQHVGTIWRFKTTKTMLDSWKASHKGQTVGNSFDKNEAIQMALTGVVAK